MIEDNKLTDACSAFLGGVRRSARISLCAVLIVTFLFAVPGLAAYRSPESALAGSASVELSYAASTKVKTFSKAGLKFEARKNKKTKKWEAHVVGSKKIKNKQENKYRVIPDYVKAKAGGKTRTMPVVSVRGIDLSVQYIDANKAKHVKVWDVPYVKHRKDGVEFKYTDKKSVSIIGVYSSEKLQEYSVPAKAFGRKVKHVSLYSNVEIINLDKAKFLKSIDIADDMIIHFKGYVLDFEMVVTGTYATPGITFEKGQKLFGVPVYFALVYGIRVNDMDHFRDATIEQIARKARSVIDAQIGPGMTDVDKVKAVHDWMVLNTAYDYENYVAGTVPLRSYSPEGVLLYGTGVCGGYATTFKLFMDVLEIECREVISEQMNHSWNLIKIADKWYHIDATWDDPVPDEPGRLRYSYFLVPDELIGEDHTWDSEPAATSWDLWPYAPLIANSVEEAVRIMESQLAVAEPVFVNERRYSKSVTFVTKGVGMGTMVTVTDPAPPDGYQGATAQCGFFNINGRYTMHQLTLSFPKPLEFPNGMVAW
jgi:hypothetical protein